MKIHVKHKLEFGIHRFYPCDKWTQEFIKVFGRPGQKMKVFSNDQIKMLKSLGFEIKIDKSEEDFDL